MDNLQNILNNAEIKETDTPCIKARPPYTILIPKNYKADDDKTFTDLVHELGHLAFTNYSYWKLHNDNPTYYAYIIVEDARVDKIMFKEMATYKEKYLKVYKNRNIAAPHTMLNVIFHLAGVPELARPLTTQEITIVALAENIIKDLDKIAKRETTKRIELARLKIQLLADLLGKVEDIDNLSYKPYGSQS